MVPPNYFHLSADLPNSFLTWPTYLHYFFLNLFVQVTFSKGNPNYTIPLLKLLIYQQFPLVLWQRQNSLPWLSGPCVVWLPSFGLLLHHTSPFVFQFESHWSFSPLPHGFYWKAEGSSWVKGIGEGLGFGPGWLQWHRQWEQNEVPSGHCYWEISALTTPSPCSTLFKIQSSRGQFKGLGRPGSHTHPLA